MPVVIDSARSMVGFNHQLLQKLIFIVLVVLRSSKACVSADNETTLICSSSDFGESVTNATRILVLRTLPTTQLAAGHHRRHFLYVEHLEISQTVLSIAASGLRGFANLETLTISNGSYQEVEKGAFAGLHKLHKLNVTNSGLKVLHPDSFKHLKKLEVLQLSNNALESLPGGVFNSLHRLKALHLESNRISSILPDTFLGLRKLSMMGLTNNSLTTVNVSQFRALHHLERLDVGFNKISAISGSINLTKLAYLKLNDNELTSLSDEVFANCTNLRKIDLYNNDLANLTEAPFLKLKKLKHVNLISTGVDVGNFQQLSAKNVFRFT